MTCVKLGEARLITKENIQKRIISTLSRSLTKWRTFSRFGYLKSGQSSPKQIAEIFED